MDHAHLARIEQDMVVPPRPTTVVEMSQRLQLDDEQARALSVAADLQSIPVGLVTRTLRRNPELALLVRRLNGRRLSEHDAAMVQGLSTSDGNQPATDPALIEILKWGQKTHPRLKVWIRVVIGASLKTILNSSLVDTTKCPNELLVRKEYIIMVYLNLLCKQCGVQADDSTTQVRRIMISPEERIAVLGGPVATKFASYRFEWRCHSCHTVNQIEQE